MTAEKMKRVYRYDRNERRTVKCLAIMFLPLVALIAIAWSQF